MRGDGRVFQRRGTPYWWIAYYHHGKEQREVACHVRTGKKIEATEKGHHEAGRFLKRRLGEIAAEQHGGRAFIAPKRERITVGGLLDSLERDYKLRDKWSRKVASNIKPVRQHFGSWRAIEVTANAVAAYILELREQAYTNATVNRRTQLLGQAFKLALRNKQVSEVPFIPRLSEVGNVRQGFFENAEHVIAQLPEYLRDFARFAFITGWRKGSIQSLRWADVGDDVIHLRAENSKTRKPETMPLEGDLCEIIERRRSAALLQDKDGSARFAEYVFHQDGEPIGDFRKAWASACCAAGVGAMVCPECHGGVDEKLHCAQCEKNWKREELSYVGRIFHDFRRTAVRDMIAAGCPQVVAMKITGHRTDAMFRRYAIVNEDQKREALARTQEYRAASAERKVTVTMRAG
jgi:integrase